jgi:hypothetical protein
MINEYYLITSLLPWVPITYKGTTYVPMYLLSTSLQKKKKFMAYLLFSSQKVKGIVRTLPLPPITKVWIQFLH